MATVSSPLLDLIRSQGMLDDLQLDEVIQEHSRSGKPISEILQDFEFLDMAAQLEIIASHLGTEVVQIESLELTPEILSAVPAEAARMYKCLPVAVHEGTVQVALADPLNPALADELAFVVGKEIIPVVADPAEIEKAVSRCYGDSQTSVADILKELGQDNELAREAAEAAATGATVDAEKVANETPIIRFVNLVSSKPSRTVPATSISSRSRTNSRSATGWTARSMKCPRPPSTWPCRSFPESRSCPT